MSSQHQLSDNHLLQDVPTTMDPARSWELYASLRNEIIHADLINMQVVGIVIGAVVLVLAAGFSQPDPIVRMGIFLCIFILTVSGYRVIKGNRRRLWRITTYMRVFLEPRMSEVNWESRLALFSGARRTRENSSSATENDFFIFVTLNWIAGVAAIFFGVIPAKDSTFLSSILSPILVLLLGSSSYNLIVVQSFCASCVLLINILLTFLWHKEEKSLQRGSEIETNFYARWMIIKDDETRNDETRNTTLISDKK